MSNKISLNLFLGYCGNRESSGLLQALTHPSFSEEKNNSRFVFNGMYHFKGKVAEWCFTNINGTGTQLQQFLGNITGKSAMDNFFDYLDLSKNIRVGKGIELSQQKHIFSFGLLGWLCEVLEQDALERIIYRFFISPNDHLLPQSYYINDPWQQLLFLCNQQGLAKPRRQVSRNEAGLYECEIKFGSERRISHTSTSYIYVQKKAIRLVLKQLVSELAEKLDGDPTHQLIKEKNEQKKQQAKETDRIRRIAEWEGKQREKKFQKVIRKKKEEERKKLEDQRRKIIKQNIKLKSKSTKQSIYREYTEEEIKALSLSKRRNLQDRGILPR